MLIWLVLLFPLVGAVWNGLLLPRHKLLSHSIAVAGVGLSFLAALPLFVSLLGEGAAGSVHLAFSWIQAGDLDIGMEFVVDRLSGVMLLIVTGIGSLIHIYAGGYMNEEKTTARFFSYLNLFIFMMLLLVLGNNMLVMFIGWEGVGLCSYLLIGYWYTHKPNAVAGMKAFVVNRIGDFGFLIGIFLTYKMFGTLSFSQLHEVLAGQESLSPALTSGLTAIGICLFIGACGKSAQLPLYVWLPDAMAGPTPVSALIHAATMVTAGIYMMTRLHFIYYLAPSALMLVAFVGGATALFAATIALVQNDIKKVLAYSTVSQLGYMVLACGVGAFDAGVFHLLTHACFKALLFLGAGSVIVALHHKQDMQEMGGLKKYLPITHAVFLVAVLAIIGFPGLSGFFSKDEILWRAFSFPGVGWVLWLMGLFAAMCTAFYMVRLLCLTFYGKNRSDEHTRHHLHETSSVMWAPLVVLAFLSIFIGYLGIPPFLAEAFHGSNLFSPFLSSVIQVPPAGEVYWSFLHEHHSEALEWSLMGASTLLALGSASFAFILYRNGPTPFLQERKEAFASVYRTLYNKYWVDELYDRIIVRPLKEMSEFLWRVVDLGIINGGLNVLGQSLMFLSGVTSFQMTGSLHRYAVVFILGLMGLVVLVIV
ncbi:MAG: NADH-quinone oxidoreductase subunit L [Deltaproteobacteria bacterium]|nr:NADH-quinone oxidoreductase subunit L [Deltaproteobacteria bacterium]